MARLRIIYVVSNVHKSLAFEWIAKGLRDRYDLSFILLNPGGSLLEEFLSSERIFFKRITYRGKSDFPVAFLKVLFIFLSKRPDVVHAHLLDAQLIGLTAAKLSGVRKRIYTRHNSDLHHVYHPSGIKYDRWSNRMATKIISISQATDKTLFELEKIKREKVIKIPHGFDLSVFENVSETRISQVRSNWQISSDCFVVGVIARHIEWKGVQFIIPAFAQFLKTHSQSVLVLANSVGPYHQNIVALVNELLPENKVIFIPFEDDVAALYKTFDVYVHTPIDSTCEAFGQTYVESLAASVPSVFTLSGIALEFVRNGENALVVPFKNPSSVATALSEFYENHSLRHRLVENGKSDVNSRFKIDSMLLALEKIYDS